VFDELVHGLGNASANLVRSAGARLKESVKSRNECKTIEDQLGLKVAFGILWAVGGGPVTVAVSANDPDA